MKPSGHYGIPRISPYCILDSAVCFWGIATGLMALYQRQDDILEKARIDSVIAQIQKILVVEVSAEELKKRHKDYLDRLEQGRKLMANEDRTPTLGYCWIQQEDPLLRLNRTELARELGIDLSNYPPLESA